MSDMPQPNHVCSNRLNTFSIYTITNLCITFYSIKVLFNVGLPISAGWAMGMGHPLRFGESCPIWKPEFCSSRNSASVFWDGLPLEEALWEYQQCCETRCLMCWVCSLFLTEARYIPFALSNGNYDGGHQPLQVQLIHPFQLGTGQQGGLNYNRYVLTRRRTH